MKTARFAFRDADLAVVWSPDSGFRVVELHIHATVADLAHRHERARDLRNRKTRFETRRPIALKLEVQNILAHVGEPASISHDKALASAAPRGQFQHVAWSVRFVANMVL